MKKKEQGIRDLQYSTKQPNIHVIGVPERGAKEKDKFKKIIITENFSCLVENVNL